MSGLQETEESHSGHPAGGRGAERARSMKEQGPSVQGAECEGACLQRGGSRVQEGDNWRVRKGVYMCKGGGWVPGCGCLK